ncbi:DUF2948 family protein [Aestuariivirga sp.]|uniref:DUF2948 family protein n=1 Tax=Aestuariivirga sp. TaxID=2650926 RepID=UPI0039E6908B
MLALAALDAEDLSVISAQMQDAVLKLGDMSYVPARKQFALVANRYAWDDAKERQRRRTGLHFDRVLKAQSHNIRQGDAEAIVSLLAISFEKGDEPSGTIVLTFAGGGAIRLTVECIEAELKDLGPAWETAHTPSHEDGA